MLLFQVILTVQCAILLWSGRARGLAKFTSPLGPDGKLTLYLGDQFLIAWQDTGTDYTMLSLGLLAAVDGMIFWLISDSTKYTNQNYLFTVALGNGQNLQQGTNFAFILVNGTNFGEQVISPYFHIAQPSTTTTAITSTTSKATSTSLTSPTESPTISAIVTPSTVTSVVLLPTTTTSTSLGTPSSPPETYSGLSTGAKVGVGVGVGVGVAVPIIAVITLGGLLHCIRNRRRPSVEHEQHTNPTTEYVNKNISSGALPPRSVEQIHEAPDQVHIYEVPAYSVRPSTAIHEAP
ncbi:hypothetical protein BGZ60DRAFT_523255 [Tricladium varicosporioides]|nr:hypothetical protein BGZ60DRAFT_523255 [Hymenoscyphus varicosporioides]